jgi:hypothetical protein
MPRKRSPNVRDALPQVSDFLRRLAKPAVAEPVDLSSYGKIFSNVEEGTVLLDADDGARYQAVLTRLITAAVTDEDISSKEVERALQRAIFFALDINRQRDSIPLDERIATATLELHRSLTRHHESYLCYVPVRGLESPASPYRFGPVTFARFNHSQLRKSYSAPKKHTMSDEKIRSRRSMFATLKKSAMWESSCALTHVSAKDPEAALLLTRRKARTAIDMMNFFIDLVPYNHGWLYLPEEAASTWDVSPILKEDGFFTIQSARRGPAIPLSLDNLKKHVPLQTFLRRTSRIFSKENPTEIEQLLLTAIQWAGRAGVAARREEAFLLFAIALESLVVPGQAPEITYRLRVRVAHLLGTKKPERLRISRDINRLYGIRSSIVHRGSYLVTDSDVYSIKWLAKRVIFNVLGSKAISRLVKKGDWENWLESKTLS